MKKLGLILLVACCYGCAHAQVFDWGLQFSGAYGSYVKALDTDNSGNICTASTFNGVTDFDPGPGTFTMQSLTNVGCVAICKLNPAGNLIWAEKIDGMGQIISNDITTDAAGNIYVAGLFSGSVDFDPGPGTFLMGVPNTLNYNAFVLKLQPNGDFIWAKSFTSNGTYVEVASIAVDAANNVITTGYFQWITDFDPGPATYSLQAQNDDAFVSKLDPNGNFLWAKQFTSSDSDAGSSVTTDASGNIYSVGAFFNSIDMDPGAGVALLTSPTSVATYLSKLDASGNFILAVKIEFSTPNRIALDPMQNILIVGSFQNGCDFDPGPLVNNGGALVDGAFVLKLGPSANFMWVNPISSSSYISLSSLSLDLAGNIYTGGFFSGLSDLDASAGTFTINATPFMDGFLAKLNALGNFVWGGQIAGDMEEHVTDVAISKSGDLYAGGYFSSSLTDLDPGPGTFSATNYAMLDAEGYIIKIAFCPQNLFTAQSSNSLICAGDQATITLGGALTYSVNGVVSPNVFVVNPVINTTYSITTENIAQGCISTLLYEQLVNPCLTVQEGIVKGNGFSAFPNPAKDKLKISSQHSARIYSVSIVNTLGQLVYIKAEINADQQIDIGFLENGIYLIKIESSEGTDVLKIIKIE